MPPEAKRKKVTTGVSRTSRRKDRKRQQPWTDRQTGRRKSFLPSSSSFIISECTALICCPPILLKREQLIKRSRPSFIYNHFVSQVKKRKKTYCKTLGWGRDVWKLVAIIIITLKRLPKHWLAIAQQCYVFLHLSLSFWFYEAAHTAVRCLSSTVWAINHACGSSSCYFLFSLQEAVCTVVRSRFHVWLGAKTDRRRGRRGIQRASKQKKSKPAQAAYVKKHIAQTR